MKKYSTILITIVLVLSFVSTAAIAQRGGGGMLDGAKGQARGGANSGAMGTMGLMNLDLDEGQRIEIQNIMQENRDAMLADCDATREEMNAIKAELAALMDDPSYNADAARQLLEDKFIINIDKQISRNVFHHQIIWGVLTADQRATLANQRANAAAFNSGMRQGSQGRMSRAGEAGICPF